MLHHYQFFTGVGVAEQAFADLSGSADAAGACDGSLARLMSLAAQADVQAICNGALASPELVQTLCFKLQVTARLDAALQVAARLDACDLQTHSRITAAVGTTPCR